MNVNEFFEQYSIEEINKKTRISPISLRFIKNKEFEKIPRVKFLGFVSIIEKEFHIDLSELIEEYNKATYFIKENNDTVKLKEPKKHNTFILLILTLILFLLGTYLLYNQYNTPKKDIINKTNQTITTPYQIDQTKYSVSETQPQNKKDQYASDMNTSQKIIPTEEINYSTSNPTQPQNNKIQYASDINTSPKGDFSKQTTSYPKTVIIIPKEKVWFKAVNIDTNKTEEYLTTHTKTLIGTNWYIKFGHGNITVNYGDKTLTPETKKIIRLLFKNGQITYMKKPNEYEK